MFSARYWNIELRTAHIGTMGVLLGGMFFDIDRSRLGSSFLACVVTGMLLGALEAGPRLTWFHQGRGLATIGKLLLFLVVPLVWSSWPTRTALMLAIVVIGSVGSHMPARFRYYSVLYREIINCHGGPGAVRLAADIEQTDQPTQESP
jgi:hypothetical protein